MTKFEVNNKDHRSKKIYIIRELTKTESTDIINRKLVVKFSNSIRINNITMMYNVALGLILSNMESDLTALKNLIYFTAKVVTAQLSIRLKIEKGQPCK